ncbi:MAG TPA: ABC transporter permease subunit [Candidatus Limnocylindria bacterium]|jgi:ABC-2 type transport system permease protein|nr:ABC transporter permease subunit [Candidatus Limnocylindria bacterium]
MNGVIARITLRQLLSRRRTLLLLLLAGLMLLVALGLRIGAEPVNRPHAAARLLEVFGTATLMPLVALLFGTATLGAELEEGTAIYLLAKPVPRWQTLLTKLVVAAACSIALTSIPVLLAGLIAGAGIGLAVAFALATAVGSLVYCAIFVALSLITGRALVFGLGYVLIWEGVLAGLFAGTQTFSVRQHTLALADALSDVPSTVFSAPLPLGTALVVGGAVLVLATVIGIRRLARIEIAGEST